MNVSEGQSSFYDVKVSCVPERGWVVVQTELTGEWENPVFELSIASTDGQPLASTLVMDAPASFRITLHPRGAEVGMPLLLRLKLISAEDNSVETLGEHPFIFESAQ